MSSKRAWEPIIAYLPAGFSVENPEGTPLPKNSLSQFANYSFDTHHAVMFWTWSQGETKTKATENDVEIIAFCIMLFGIIPNGIRRGR
jgi:hypothetical protein